MIVGADPLPAGTPGIAVGPLGTCPGAVEPAAGEPGGVAVAGDEPLPDCPDMLLDWPEPLLELSRPGSSIGGLAGTISPTQPRIWLPLMVSVPPAAPPLNEKLPAVWAPEDPWPESCDSLCET